MSMLGMFRYKPALITLAVLAAIFVTIYIVYRLKERR